MIAVVDDPVTDSNVLDPLSVVVATGTANVSKALGPFSGVVDTATATATVSKALGPLAGAQQDIFARCARSIAPAERWRPSLALSVRRETFLLAPLRGLATPEPSVTSFARTPGTATAPRASPADSLAHCRSLGRPSRGRSHGLAGARPVRAHAPSGCPGCLRRRNPPSAGQVLTPGGLKGRTSVALCVVAL
jgi:hypothetical protein